MERKITVFSFRTENCNFATLVILILEQLQIALQ
jgi:hypothetical protein